MHPYKIILAILLYLTISISFSQGQQYPIPGATQQPEWVFPLFFEDSIGQKDTIYLGYDWNISNNFGCFDDGLYGEAFIYHNFFDSIQFISYRCVHAGPGGNDSITKVDVTNFNFPSFDFYVRNAYYPLTIKWDKSLLYSDSLPFPNNPGLPKAEVVLYWDNGINIPNNINCLFTNILITDTCNYYCCAVDSMVFIDANSNAGSISSFFGIIFRPWTGLILDIEDASNPPQLNIYPNPVRSNNEITIESNTIMSFYKIYRIDGSFMSEGPIENNLINIGNLTSGLYFVELHDFVFNKVFKKFLVY